MVTIKGKWKKVKKHRNPKALKGHANALKKRGLNVKTKGNELWAKDPKYKKK